MRSWLLTVLLGLLGSALAAASVASPEPEENAVLAVVPFEASNEPNRILVNLSPEGSKPLVWMLDTGAASSVLTPRVARSNGISVRKGKSTAYRRGTRLGRDIQFYIDTQSSDTASRTGWEYGLLGGEFLEQYVVELDFEKRRVRFLDPDVFRVPESVTAQDEAVISMKLPSRRPVVPLEMNGRTLEVLFDTGAPGTMVLSGAAARKFGIDTSTLESFGEFGTTAGAMKVNFHEADRFSFAGFEFGRTPTFIAPRGWYNIGGNNDSVIGYDIISSFTVRLDYPRKRIWLRQNRPEATYFGMPYELTRAAGVFLFKGQGAYGVLGVTKGSPAARLGIQPGDILSAVLSSDRDTLPGLLKRIANEEPIVVTRVSGEMIDEVTLGAKAPDADARAEQAKNIAADDQKRAEAWQDRNSERLFMEERGRWIIIEGYRRRQGPKPDEEWMTFEEMQERKRARSTPAAN